MVFGLGKKEGQSNMNQGPDLSTPPLDYVLQMRSQGMNNDQIIQTLQRMGFDHNLILEGMNQAEMKGNTAMQIPPDMIAQNPDPSNEMQPPSPTYMQEPEQQMPQFPSPEDMQGMPMPPPQFSMSHEHHGEKTEELIESIIEEKWDEFSKNINKIVEWKNKTESKINVMEQQLKDLKADFDKLHSAVLGKVEEYDQNILNVGTEIKAMEKVFQKVLPTLTENVNELSRLTGKAKTAKKK